MRPEKCVALGRKAGLRVRVQQVEGWDGGCGGGRETQEEGIYVTMADSRCTAETSMILQNSYPPIKNEGLASLVAQWWRFHVLVQEMGLIPDPRRSHMLRSSQALAPQFLSPRAATAEARAP